ncbi:MAG: hypothetical protein CSB06_01350 [Bacteroidia bacterium]|nr:MAG: hypothetical protein CSB06_01350 [Bacteroidia bacterium]
MNTKKIASTLFFICFLFFVGYFIFKKTPDCKEVIVEYTSENPENRLLDESYVKKVIADIYPNIVGTSFRDLNLRTLENTLQKIPAVLETEAYRTQQGVLHIRMQSRQPLVRVMPLRGKDFFIDETGHLIPAHTSDRARVPIASGYIHFRYNEKTQDIKNIADNKQIGDIYKLAKSIAKDTFWRAQIEQIYFTKDNKIELVPKVGKHIVMLGTTDRYKNKLRNLKKMYIKVLQREGWNKYNYLNIEYKDQIVCTRNTKER